MPNGSRLRHYEGSTEPEIESHIRGDHPIDTSVTPNRGGIERFNKRDSQWNLM
jgi:hypothetical protein